jgi:hypothetical protein
MESVPRISHAPPLVESVVRREMESRPAEDPLRMGYRRLLDETYLYEGSERASAAHRVHEFYFRRLGWAAFFRSLLAGFPAGLKSVGVVAADGVEGCFVGASRRLLIRLRPSRFGDRGALERYLRHELAHASDVLDPAFGYRAEALDEPTRRRYADLWCASIEARRGGESIEPVTHAGLLQRARALSTPKCPLCALPSTRRVAVPEPLAARLREEVPGWSPDEALCERCIEWAELRAARKV